MNINPSDFPPIRSASAALPFPVPLRACFIKSKGGTGIPSKRYKDYRVEAADALKHMPRFTGPVHVSIAFNAPDKRKRDGDNLLKCLFDALVHNEVIEDDNNRIVRAASWNWSDDGPPCFVTVTSLDVAS